MKKLFLAIAISLMSSAGFAQNMFSITANPVDSFTTGTTDTLGLMMLSHVINNTSSTLALNWEIISDSTDRPSGWIFTQFCDINACYLVPPLEGVWVEPGGCLIPAGLNSQLAVWGTAPTWAPDGIGTFKLKVYDTALTQIDTVIINLHKGGVGINDKRNKIATLNVYPNPATEKIVLNLNEYSSGTDNAILSVYNILGRCVMQQNIKKRQQIIDISALPKGVYWLKLHQIGKGLGTCKLVKQ